MVEQQFVELSVVGSSPIGHPIYMKQQKLQYCPICGGKASVKKDDKSLFLECKGGHRFYINPNPTVSAIIYSGKKILLTKRAIEPFIGKWDLINGYMELGETPVEAIKREVAEEIKAEFLPESIFAFNTSEYYLNDLQKNMNIYFYGQLDSIKKLNIDKKEILQVKWFDFNKIPYNKVAFKHHIPVIKEFIEVQNRCAGCVYRESCNY